MTVGIYLRVDAPSQRAVAEAVFAGCLTTQETVFVFSDHAQIADADTVVVFGIGGDAKSVWMNAKEAGKRVVLLDKAYIRALNTQDTPRYWLLRVAVDDFQPLRYFQLATHSSERWDKLGVPVAPYQKRVSGDILFDGASNKYVAWLGSGNGVGTAIEQWGQWGQRMVDQIRAYTDVPITYRPRPSNNPAPPISGARLSCDSLKDDLSRCRLVVSDGGNIGYDAVVAGVPHFAIGDSIARPISETAWIRVGTPCIPSDGARSQWLSDIAWTQWNLDEFRSGAAWRYVRDTMEQIDGLSVS